MDPLTQIQSPTGSFATRREAQSSLRNFISFPLPFVASANADHTHLHLQPHTKHRVQEMGRSRGHQYTAQWGRMVIIRPLGAFVQFGWISKIS
jgi:hypothetical protein